MKLPTSLALLLGSLFLSGCESTSEGRTGMTEKQWLRNAVLADPVYTEGSVTAYKSNRQYYYFHNGILVKIDPNRIPAQNIADLNRPAQPTQVSPPVDVYTELKKLDELRKSGIITEEEFQAQKKKTLERK